jgi:hypothetical protein
LIYYQGLNERVLAGATPVIGLPDDDQHTWQVGHNQNDDKNTSAYDLKVG